MHSSLEGTFERNKHNDKVNARMLFGKIFVVVLCCQLIHMFPNAFKVLLQSNVAFYIILGVNETFIGGQRNF